jgi:hypothetical protein
MRNGTASSQQLDLIMMDENDSQAIGYVLIEQLRWPGPITGMIFKATSMNGVYIHFVSFPVDWIAFLT